MNEPDDTDAAPRRLPAVPRLRDPDAPLPLLSVGRWLVLTIGTVLLLAVAAIAVELVVNGQTVDQRHLLSDRIDPARLALSRLGNALIDQETGLRGFELTHERSFLSPYQEGITNETLYRGELQNLLRGGVVDYADDLQRTLMAARAWQAGFSAPVLAGRASDAVDTQGKTLFDGLRTQLKALSNALTDRRQRALSALDNDNNLTEITLIVAGVLIVVGIVGAGFVLRRFVTAPLARLGREARRATAGDFTVPIAELAGAREIVEVRADVEAMRALVVSELEASQRARDELQRQSRELERSNNDLEQFAYVASHDLQEPLRKVASFCQALERRYAGQLDERADTYIHYAVDGAKRMQVLVNDLLAFSRVGRSGRELAAVPARTLVDDALAALGTAVSDSGATVDVGELPTVTVDRTLMASVFQNLIGNAIKFRGEAAPVVSVTAQARDDGLWEFAVSDNGIGIDPEYAERIFMIFQRLHPRDEFGGTGIGLAMARKIVEYHGGTIALDPTHAPGTRIRFTLPHS